MALILYRLMRQRLKRAKSELPPERALAQLRGIHRHHITLNNHPLSGISTLTKEQASVLRDLGLKRPSESEQLPLL